MRPRERLEAAMLTLVILACLQLIFTWWVHYGRNPRYRAAQVEICVDRCLESWELQNLKDRRK